MTIGISRELLSLNFKRLNIFCPRIKHPCKKLWQFEFLNCFSCSILSVTICYASESDIRVKSYDHLNFSRASVFQFWASRYVMHLIGHSCEMLWPSEFLERFRCSISSVSIYYIPESDIRVKIYDHLNFLRASVVHFGASRYVMRLN